MFDAKSSETLLDNFGTLAEVIDSNEFNNNRHIKQINDIARRKEKTIGFVSEYLRKLKKEEKIPQRWLWIFDNVGNITLLRIIFLVIQIFEEQ